MKKQFLSKRRYIIVTIILISILFSFFVVKASNSFETRRQEWLNSDGRVLDGRFSCNRNWLNWYKNYDIWHNCAEVFAWLENGKHKDCSQPYKDVDGDGEEEYACVGSIIKYFEKGVHIPGAKGAVNLIRILYQYGDKITAAQRKEINNFFHDELRRPYLFSRVGNDFQPTQLVARYLYSLEDRNARVKFGRCNYYQDKNNPHANKYGWVKNQTGNPDDVPPSKRMTCRDDWSYKWAYAFSYNGRTYVPGYTYNSYELSRDMLYYVLDSYVVPGVYELDSPSYTQIGLQALRTLYDFSARPLQRLNGKPDPEGLEMKKKAKMVLDLIMLDDVDDFSANQRGGDTGRTYRSKAIHEKDSPCFYVYWGLENSSPDSSSCYDAYVSSYRLNPIIEDFGILDDESSSYWRLVKENNRASFLPTNMGKWNFVTKYFNLGGAPVGRWQLNLLSTDKSYWGRVGIPFKLWINKEPGDADLAACKKVYGPTGECYNKLGEGGYQYRNSMFVKIDNPILHITKGNTFDIGEDNLIKYGEYERDYKLAHNGWNFFQENKEALVLRISSRSAALEVVVLDPSCHQDFCYSNLESFKNAVYTNSRLGSDYFINSRGRKISFRDNGKFKVATVDGRDVFQFPFPRLAVESSEGKVAQWNNKIFTLSLHRRKCTYDFNNWTYSGNGCGEIITSPRKPLKKSSDINQDGKVNIQDLGILLSNWGKTDKGRYDINQDEKTNSGDAASLLSII